MKLARVVVLLPRRVDILGLVPQSAEKGDAVYLLAGGLRPTITTGSGRLRLLGESYGHGLMTERQ